MASFIQWATSFKTKGVAPRATWICGDNLVLVEEVVDQLKKSLSVPVINYETYTVGTVKESSIWASLYRLSLDVGQPTLTIIRDAQKITDWEPLHLYLKIKSEGTGYVILVSDESDFPRDRPKGDQKLGDLKAHIRLVQSKGAIVRCITPNEEELVKWAKTKLPRVAESVLVHMVQRAGHNTKAIRDVCAKLRVFKPASVTVKVVDSLVIPSAVEELADSLVAGDKKAALLSKIEEDESTALIRLLDSRVDLLHNLYLGSIINLSVRDVCAKYRLSDFLVRKYSPHARMYDASRRDRLKRMLAILEEQSMAGAREGVAEALVALW